MCVVHLLCKGSILHNSPMVDHILHPMYTSVACNVYRLCRKDKTEI